MNVDIAVTSPPGLRSVYPLVNRRTKKRLALSEPQAKQRFAAGEAPAKKCLRLGGE